MWLTWGRMYGVNPPWNVRVVTRSQLAVLGRPPWLAIVVEVPEPGVVLVGRGPRAHRPAGAPRHDSRGQERLIDRRISPEPGAAGRRIGRDGLGLLPGEHLLIEGRALLLNPSFGERARQPAAEVPAIADAIELVVRRAAYALDFRRVVVGAGPIGVAPARRRDLGP